MSGPMSPLAELECPMSSKSPPASFPIETMVRLLVKQGEAREVGRTSMFEKGFDYAATKGQRNGVRG